MLKSVISAAAIFVLLFAVCFLPANASARRCPAKMPETLLALYQNSTEIHLARFDKAEDGEISENTDDYTAISIKKHFSISSTLKGESRKFFVLDEVDYRYKMTEEAGDREEMEDPEASVKLSPGDTLILFLKAGEDEAGIQLTDYRDGTKKLSADEIGVYEARIKDLNAIFGAEKVDEFEIVRWLIKCAENPVTRWEGTFELLQSVNSLEWEEKEVERRDEQLKRGEAVEPIDAAEPEKEGVFVTGTTIFAKILDANQKQALSNLLLDTPVLTEEEAEKSVIVGDAELIELVQRWGDSRLPVYLMDQLRAGPGDPYAVSQLMNSIAGILGDDEATSLAYRYAEISYEDDSSQAPDEAQPDEIAEAEPAGKDVAVSVDDLAAEVPVTAETAEPANLEAAEEKDGEPAKKQTYKELRADLQARFVARSEQVLLERQRENEIAASASSNP